MHQTPNINPKPLSIRLWISSGASIGLWISSGAYVRAQEFVHLAVESVCYFASA
jgi:hypothetical protein